MTLSDFQLEQFHDLGHVTVHDVVDQQTVAAALADIDSWSREFLDRLTADPAGGGVDQAWKADGNDGSLQGDATAPVAGPAGCHEGQRADQHVAWSRHSDLAWLGRPTQLWLFNDSSKTLTSYRSSPSARGAERS